MKQYTTPEQTAKLIELGFESPQRNHIIEWNGTYKGNYSIGELIEIIDGKATFEIDNIGGSWMVSMPIFDSIGAELIDCLFEACVKLKEEE